MKSEMETEERIHEKNVKGENLKIGGGHLSTVNGKNGNLI